MIAKGHWTGFYKYDNKAHQQTTGFEQTYFNIEILETDKNNFIGKVEDDLTTGGTKGIGDIVGSVMGNNIEFVKHMPIMTLVAVKQGKRKTYNKKHPKIYYSGTFSNDSKSISGEWKIKFGFIWIGFLPIIGLPTKGTWEMHLKK